MSERTILLIGGPDSGKTNFVGCLWEALRAREGQLVAPTAPERVKYVEDALEHLMQGRFAPRTEPGSEEQAEPFSIPVLDQAAPDAPARRIIVPDVTGELWKKAVETCELPPDWMHALRDATGVLLFVRIGSDQNVDPLDWVSSARLLTLHAKRLAAAAKAEGEDANNAPADEAAGADLASEPDAQPEEPAVIIPTQVLLCELVRFMEHAARVAGATRPKRLAVLVTAWDRLDHTRRAAGPRAFLEAEYPLFHGRLESLSDLEMEVFGVSVVGGDFLDPQFHKRYLEGDPEAVGYVVRSKETGVARVEDLTLPVAWVLGDSSSAP